MSSSTVTVGYRDAPKPPGKSHLIRAPLMMRVADEQMRPMDRKAFVLASFGREVHPDCIGCASANLQSEVDHTFMTTRYRVSCTQTSCKRAAWTMGRPMKIATPISCLPLIDDDLDITDIISQEPDAPQIAGAGAW